MTTHVPPRPAATAHAPSGRPSRVRVGEALVLLGRASKPSAGTPLYSRLVNRRLGRWLAALALRLGATPNAVSLTSAACTFPAVAIIAVARPSTPVAVVVTALLVLGYALDSADGQVARATGGGSLYGEWLDHMIDATKVSTLHVAVLCSALRNPGSPRWAVGSALLFAVVAAVTFFGMVLTDQLRRAAGVPKATEAPASSDLLRAVLVLPTDYGVLCLAFLLLGRPGPFYAVYAALAVGSLLLLGVAVVRWARQLRGLSAQEVTA